MSKRLIALPVLAALALGACATVPTGPSVMVLPGAGRPFEQFQTDDAVCRQFASGQAGAPPGSAIGRETVTGAAVGTLLGAAAGAAIGAAAGNAGAGAAIGAGGGFLGGAAVGAGSGQTSGYELQRRYDAAYQQCMYAKGHQIQVRGGSYTASPPPPPPPPMQAPPPPPPPPLR
jgi:outer membrane lipoprotein SlyB